MNRNHRIVLLTILGAVLAVAALAGAGRLLANTLATNYAPEQVNYQGYLTDNGGNPISGTVTLQFSIWDASTNGNQIWDETHNSVAVNAGYFSVLLGSQGSPLTADDFKGSPRYLQVVYDATTFPRQIFGSVPYALVANYATEAVTATYALNGSGANWQYVVIVAKSGGDYTSINAALAAITPTSSSRYLVRVMPGVYTETVTLPQYVHLEGSGAGVTRITSSANNNSNGNTSIATLVVPANTQVSEISVVNDATTNVAAAIYINNGNPNTVLTSVRAFANGAGGGLHEAYYLGGGNPTLTHVYGEASGATASFNTGLFNSASSPTLHDVTLTATGNDPVGLRLNGGNPIIKESTISGKNGNDGKGIDSSGSNSTVKIDRSTIAGDPGAPGSSINSTDLGDIFYVGASMLDGDVDVTLTSDAFCAQSYDGAYTDVLATCL